MYIYSSNKDYTFLARGTDRNIYRSITTAVKTYVCVCVCTLIYIDLGEYEEKIILKKK